MKKPNRKKKRRTQKRELQTKQNTTSDDNAEFLVGLTHHREGNFDLAKSSYFKALAMNERHGDAWHMLGMAFYQTGHLDESIECLGNARAVLAPSASLFSNLGIVLLAAKQMENARTALEAARDLAPQQASVRSNLGSVYLELNEPKLAEEEFRVGLELEPENEQLLSNLGNALQSQRRFNDAEALYQKVLAKKPNSAIWNNLGSVLRATGKYDLAVEAFKKSIELKCTENAVVNLGRALTKLGRLDEARSVMTEAIEAWPNSAIGYHFLGKIYAEAGHHQLAVNNFQKALEIDPAYAQAYGSQGMSFGIMGETEQSIVSLKKAIELRPDFMNYHADLLYTLSLAGDLSQQELFEEHVKWGETVCRSITPRTEFANVQTSDRKLRIGYASGDFRKHAVMKFFEPVLNAHDRKRFEIFCYSETHDVDDITDRIRDKADHWRSTCGLSNQQIANQIHDDEIDILVDLAGHTCDNRLVAFAHKPAPVQATWLGYPNTTGLKQIDYRITNEIQDPVGEPSYHVEQIVRLPYGSDCFCQPEYAPDVVQSPVLTNGYVTFGSLQRPRKITEEVLQLWAGVLKSVPNSRLLLCHTHYLNSTQIVEFPQQLIDLGIDKERIEVQYDLPNGNHYSVYHSIDIALDVFPWNGGTTSREALWMGVPIVGLLGNSRSSRATAALLHLARLDELTAKSKDQYVSIASGLANDIDRLASLRDTMRERLIGTVGNAKRLTAELEKAYLAMWTRWCKGQTASSDVPAGTLAKPPYFVSQQSYQSDVL